MQVKNQQESGVVYKCDIGGGNPFPGKKVGY